MAHPDARRARPEETLRDEVQTAIINIYDLIQGRIAGYELPEDEAGRVSTITRQAIHDAAQGYITAVEENPEERIPTSQLERELLGWAVDVAEIYPVMEADEWEQLPDGMPDRTSHAESYELSTDILLNTYHEREASAQIADVSSHASQLSEGLIGNALERREVQALINSALVEASAALGERRDLDLTDSGAVRLALVREARQFLDDVDSGGIDAEEITDLSLPDPETQEGRYVRADIILASIERAISSEYLSQTRGGDLRAGMIGVMDESTLLVGRHVTEPLIQDQILGHIEHSLDQARQEITEVGSERVDIGDARSRLIDRSIELLSAQREMLERAWEDRAASRLQIDPEKIQIAINILAQIRHEGQGFMQRRPRLRR